MLFVLTLSGLFAFFPSPMKWEKSSVCCSRNSKRFPEDPDGILADAGFGPADASGAGVGHDEDVVEDEDDEDSVDMMTKSLLSSLLGPH